MTAQGAGSGAARRWQALRHLPSRTSLRAKLVTAVLALVAVALVVMGFVAIAVFGGYLQDQVDAQVRSLDTSVQHDPFAFSGGSHQDMILLNDQVVEVLDGRGQLVPGLGNPQELTSPGPAVPASDTGPNGTSGQPVTVPALSGGTDWRVITQPVQYNVVQPDGSIVTEAGTLVVGFSLGNLDQNMAYLTRLDVSVSALILIVLAMIGFAEYYRQRGGLVRRWDRDQPAEAADPAATGLTPDDLDRIMQRVEKEAARMGLLVEDLLLLV